jgi:hypothetical protein
VIQPRRRSTCQLRFWMVRGASPHFSHCIPESGNVGAESRPPVRFGDLTEKRDRSGLCAVVADAAGALVGRLRCRSGARSRARYRWLVQSDEVEAAVGVSAAQVRPDLLIQALPGIAGCHRDPDLPNGHPDLGTDLQQLCPDSGNLRLCQFCPLQTHTA